MDEQRPDVSAHIGGPGFSPVAASQAAALPWSEAIYDRLLAERIIILGTEVNDDVGNRICAQMLLLAAEDPTADIAMYINSPGGSISAGMAIFDTMNLIQCDVSTFAMGMAASMGQFLLSAGQPGKRHALPNAAILMHQPLGGLGGSETDVTIQADRLRQIKHRMAELISGFTGQTVEQVRKDGERDRWFTADEARDYGLVDHVITRSVEAPTSDPTHPSS